MSPSTQVRITAGIDENTTFLVSSNGQHWSYQALGIEIPNRFWRDSNLYLQLQDDLRVAVVEPTANFPVKDLPQQPPGFPLHPSLVKK
jgi:hypothetical protein